MGDARFDPVYERVRDAPDRAAAIRALKDDEAVQALGGAARGHDLYLTNILASEVINRVDRSQAVMDNLGEGVVSLDSQGTIQMMNAAAARLAGWTDAAIGANIHALVHPRETRPDTCRFARDISDPRTREGDTTFVTGAGSSMPVGYTTSPLIRNEERMGTVLVFRDDTPRIRSDAIEREQAAVLEATARNALRELRARRHAQDALAMRERQLADAQRIGRIGSWEWDVRSDRVTWSDELYRLFGRKKGEEPTDYGSYLSALVPTDRPVAEAAISRSMRTGEPFQFEHRVVMPDGSIRHILGSGIVEMREGAVVRMIGTAQDITHAHRMTEELTRRLEELSELNVRLKEFVHIVSHELKSPLTLMQGYLQLVRRDAGEALSESDVSHLKRSLEAAEGMELLIEDLVSYAESESGNAPLEPTQLDDALDQALRMLHAPIEERRATIRVDPNLPAVLARPREAKQLFLNLLENAIKYADGPPRIEVSATESDDVVTIHVRDHGPGIPTADAQRIFEPFVRLGHADLPGSGIGLAVCKRIVENAGGAIWVDEPPGGGAAFHMTFHKVRP